MFLSLVGRRVTSLSSNRRRPFRRNDKAGDDVEQRRLAAARRPQQRVGHALLPDMVERLERVILLAPGLAPVGVGDSIECDARHRFASQAVCAMNGVVARPPELSNTKDAVRVDARFDLRARLPLMHARREADPNAEADIDMNETFRPAELGHLHLPGKVEAWRLSVADGHGVGAKAKPINAVRQSRQRADEGQIATAFQRDERAALLDDELIQRRDRKRPAQLRYFRVFDRRRAVGPT